MSLQKDSAENITRLKVIGIGGAGINAVNAMLHLNLQRVEFMTIAAENSALLNSQAEKKLLVSLNAELCSAEDEALSEYISDADLVLLVAGMGGTTATQLTPLIAAKVKSAGKLVMALTSLPFASEGKKRLKVAQEGIDEFRTTCDSLIIIPNDQLCKVQQGRDSFFDTFKVADDILCEVIRALTEQGREYGDCLVDFNRIHRVVSIPGTAGITIGVGSGESRVQDAISQAMSSPLLGNFTIQGAEGLIVSVTGASNFSVHEFKEIVSIFTDEADENVAVISGMAVDETLEHQIKVVVISTGLKEKEPPKTLCDKSNITPASCGAFGITSIFKKLWHKIMRLVVP
jgi:cell division protein FtsZ